MSMSRARARAAWSGRWRCSMTVGRRGRPSRCRHCATGAASSRRRRSSWPISGRGTGWCRGFRQTGSGRSSCSSPSPISSPRCTTPTTRSRSASTTPIRRSPRCDAPRPSGRSACRSSSAGSSGCWSNPAGPGHLVGDRLSYADLSLFQVVAGLEYAFPKAARRVLAECPRVAALARAVAARPRIAAYLASPRRIPFNEEGIFRRYRELDG